MEFVFKDLIKMAKLLYNGSTNVIHFAICSFLQQHNILICLGYDTLVVTELFPWQYCFVEAF